MTRTVTDAAIVLSLISGPDPLDPLTADAPHPSIDYAADLSLHSASEFFKGKRFGVPRDLMSHPPCKINEVFDEKVRIIEQLGGVVVNDVELRHIDAILARSSEMVVMNTEFKVGFPDGGVFS